MRVREPDNGPTGELLASLLTLFELATPFGGVEQGKGRMRQRVPPDLEKAFARDLLDVVPPSSAGPRVREAAQGTRREGASLPLHVRWHALSEDGPRSPGRRAGARCEVPAMPASRVVLRIAESDPVRATIHHDVTVEGGAVAENCACQFVPPKLARLADRAGGEKERRRHVCRGKTWAGRHNVVCVSVVKGDGDCVLRERAILEPAHHLAHGQRRPPPAQHAKCASKRSGCTARPHGSIAGEATR